MTGQEEPLPWGPDRLLTGVLVALNAVLGVTFAVVATMAVTR